MVARNCLDLRPTKLPDLHTGDAHYQTVRLKGCVTHVEWASSAMIKPNGIALRE